MGKKSCILIFIWTLVLSNSKALPLVWILVRQRYFYDKITINPTMTQKDACVFKNEK